MKIIQSYLTKHPCFKQNVNQADQRYITFQKEGPKGLMLHSVGSPVQKASVFVERWNREDYDRACVHAFIDGYTGEIYQTLPWNYRAWHAGGQANNTCIGVEMCEVECIRYTSQFTFEVLNDQKAIEGARITYNAAVELFSYLCKLYSLDPLKDIISHYEGYLQGVAANHEDPEHYWKGLGLAYTMNQFREDVKKQLEEIS